MLLLTQQGFNKYQPSFTKNQYCHYTGASITRSLCAAAPFWHLATMKADCDKRVSGRAANSLKSKHSGQYQARPSLQRPNYVLTRVSGSCLPLADHFQLPLRNQSEDHDEAPLRPNLRLAGASLLSGQRAATRQVGRPGQTLMPPPVSIRVQALAIWSIAGIAWLRRYAH